MKIVRITHYRCNEPDGYTFAVVPEGKTDEEVEADVQTAQALYFQAVAAFKAASKEPSADWGGKPLDTYADNITIGEAKRLREEATKKHREYEELRLRATTPYDTFLNGLGYRSLWDDLPGIIECDVNWGHRHGEHLDYTSKTPDGYDPNPTKVDREDLY